MKLKLGLSIAAMTLMVSLAGSPALAQSEASRASGNSSIALSLATGSVVVGSASLLVGGSVLVVKAVEKAGESVVLMLEGASEGVAVSVRVAASAVGNSSLAAGSVVHVVAETSGYALYLAGTLIAFIPNEIGRSLVHHSEATRPGRFQ